MSHFPKSEDIGKETEEKLFTPLIDYEINGIHMTENEIFEISQTIRAKYQISVFNEAKVDTLTLQ